MIRRTLIREEKVYREIEEAGCVAFSVLMERLQTTRSKLFYVLDQLRQEGRVGSIILGRVALWCTSRAAAEEVLSKLSEALKRLLCVWQIRNAEGGHPARRRRQRDAEALLPPHAFTTQHNSHADHRHLDD